MDFFQPFPGHMGINLGGGNIGMAEHSLYRTQIGPVFQQVGGERMAQGMGSNVFGDARFPGVAFNDLPEPLPCQPPPVSVEKKKPAPFAFLQKRPAELQIAMEFGGGRFSDRHDPFFAPFAECRKIADLELKIFDF